MSKTALAVAAIALVIMPAQASAQSDDDAEMQAPAAGTQRPDGPRPSKAGGPVGNNGSVHREKMAHFKELMVGKWTGEGWILLPGGKKTEFTSFEHAFPMVGDTAIQIIGKHHSKEEGRPLVHDALGIISWSDKHDSYKMNSWLATGPSGTYPVKATEDGYVWSMKPYPGITMRYKAIFDKDEAGTPRWTEIGEISGNGKDWTRSFEMVLTRNPDAPAAKP